MRPLLVLATLAMLATPTAAQTFCATDACFEATDFTYVEYASTVPGMSDYLMALTGTWTGGAFNALSDYWWHARFDGFETSSRGRTVHVMWMTPGVLTTSYHEERSQPQGLSAPSWDRLALRAGPAYDDYWTAPLFACGGGCQAIAASETPLDEPVSVPEPSTAWLLLPGLAMLAHRGGFRGLQ